MLNELDQIGSLFIAAGVVIGGVGMVVRWLLKFIDSVERNTEALETLTERVSKLESSIRNGHSL